MNLHRNFQPPGNRILTMLGVYLSPAAYLLACALLSCLLAYPLSFATRDFLGFHTLTSRGATLILVLGLFWLGRRLQFQREQIGIAASNREFFSQFTRGFRWGVLMLGLHVALLIWIGARHPNPGGVEFLRLARLAGKALLIGLAVASVEESVFRGFLLGSLLRRLSPAQAVLTSSFYFAALHFVHSDMKPTPEQIDWTTSFRFALDSFANLAHIKLDAFLALFTAGLFLACVRLIVPRGLGWCIGIHAGWVFVIKTAKPFTHVDLQSDWRFLLSHFDGVIGYLSALWISILILILVWHYARRPFTRPAQ